jgi:uncharacterized repeat protein (TIGR01451 family)
LKKHSRIGLGFLSLALLVTLGLALGASLAQRPQGPWLNLETSISPGEVTSGTGFMTTLTLRNEGTEPATVEAISAVLPAGTSYVGQALGSDVADPAEVEPEGLRWRGPFTLAAGAELTIRFWAIAGKQTAPGEYSVQAAALEGEGDVVSADLPLVVVSEATPELSAAQPSSAERAPAMPSAVEVSKTALPTVVEPGSSVAYSVTFSNDGTSPVTLNTITDELPTGFEYVGLAYGSQIAAEPTDKEEPEIVWQGSFDVPAGGELILRYWVWVPKGGRYSTTPYTNSVTANNGAIGPAHADVTIDIQQVYIPLVFRNYTFPYFTVTKTASAASVVEGSEVVYTVRLSNGGDDPGVLNTIEDTLPAGFTFLGMATGSDVTTLPSGTTGKIVWTGSWTVAAHDDLTLAYRVQASSTRGTYVNSATATTLVGRAPATPATATVTVGPLILFEDDFEDGIDAWTPFLNNWRLHEEQWFWDRKGGYGESWGYTHYWAGGVADPERGAHDALTMYLGEGAEQWSNYRFSVRFDVMQGPKAGVWFLGEHRDVDTDGQWLTGYYAMVRVRDTDPDEVQLLQLRTEIEPGQPPAPPWYCYHFSNPLELTSEVLATNVSKDSWHKLTIEVEKLDVDEVRIKIWVDNELAIDYIDDEGSVFTEGTIGLRTYGSPNVGFAVVRFDDVLVEPLD